MIGNIREISDLSLWQRIVRLFRTRPRPQFGEDGLRFDIDYLSFLGPVGVLRMPIEDMAEYVDQVAKEEIDNGSGSIIASVTDCTEENMKRFNATSIGIIAYVALYHRDKNQRSLARAILALAYDFFVMEPKRPIKSKKLE